MCRDQVIYPDSLGEMVGKGWRDEDLLEVLHTVHLAHILAREGGWDTAADWKVHRQPLIDLCMAPVILFYSSGVQP